MVEVLISNRSRDLWSEVKRMKGRSRKSACTIDGVNGDKDIADIFSEKYNTLYNSVPFDKDDMLCIRSTIVHDCKILGVQVMWLPAQMSE